MNQDIAIPKNELPVVMRSGLVHWIPLDKHANLRAVLAGQAGHTFVSIPQLGITINTADISGVYSLSEYESLTKIKQGMFQCFYRKWHFKKEECHCASDHMRAAEAARKKREQDAEYSELTPEQKEHATKRMDEIRRKLGFLAERKRDSKQGYGINKNALERYKLEHDGKEYTLGPDEYVIDDSEEISR